MNNKPLIDQVAKIVPEVKVFEEIGSGGFKVVYRAKIGEQIEALKLAQIPSDPKDSLIRARAGLSHTLLEATSNGHCALPQKTLIENSVKLLEIDQSLVELAIEKEIALKTIIRDLIENKTCIFLASYHFYERQIAKLLLVIKNSSIQWGDNNALELLPQIEQEFDINLAKNQKEAIVQALSEKLMVITGGPGTGKTTLVKTLLKVLESKQLDIKLCAPTGRAAKRLSETTGLEATTIHRLLEIDQVQGGFKYNEDNKGAPILHRPDKDRKSN